MNRIPVFAHKPKFSVMVNSGKKVSKTDVDGKKVISDSELVFFVVLLCINMTRFCTEQSPVCWQHPK